MKRIHEQVKFDVGLVSQAVNNTNVTGEYGDTARVKKLCYVLNGAAMAASTTTALQILQATDTAGTSAKNVTSALATITANTNVTEATVALAAAANTDTVTITSTVDGVAQTALTFTMAAATAAASREFQNAAGLVTCVNDATYGVTGVTASASGTTVTLKSTTRGRAVMTVVGGNVAGTVTVATTKAQAYVEVEVAGNVDRTNSFRYLAPKVTTTANTVVAVEVLAEMDWMPRQAVGASTAI